MFDQLSERLRGTLKSLRGQARLTEDNISDAMREVRMALLEADVSLPVARAFIERVKEKAVGVDVVSSLTPGQAVIKVVQDELVELMGSANESLALNVQPPAVVLMAGLQGAGKTTTAAKLARLLTERDSKRVMMVSADIYRPAAIEQLARLATQIDVALHPSSTDQKPEDIVRGALEAAKKQMIDVLLVDTAGRLHVDGELMEEIKRVHAVANPVETLFVVDSMTGQDAVTSAKAFDEALPLTGVVLTKTDGDARGGAALSIRHVTGKPIKFMGTGEAIDALEAFHPDRVASRILGMGDVLTLVEEVEQKVDRDKAEKMAKKLAKGKGFDLEDFRDQMMQMQNMGGMQSLITKLPGVADLPKEALNQVDDKQTGRVIAIINSMTPAERQKPDIIRGSRKKRIAAGAGTQIQEVNRLLKQHKQMQKMMGKMKKKGGMKKMMRGMPGMADGGIPGLPGMPPGPGKR